MGRNPKGRLLVLVVSALFLAGCAGAHTTITADRLKYPVSLSPALPDEKGKPLHLDKELRPVGDFGFSRTAVGYLYSLTDATIDISDELNREVESRNGKGIVDLSLEVRNCASSWFFPLTAIPFYPGCQNLSVTGTVVEREPAARDPGRGMP